MSTDKYYTIQYMHAPNAVVHDDLHILWTIFRYYVWISCIVDDLNALCVIVTSNFSRGHADFFIFFYKKIPVLCKTPEFWSNQTGIR
jgi:hypothetical protein